MTVLVGFLPPQGLCTYSSLCLRGSLSFVFLVNSTSLRLPRGSCPQKIFLPVLPSPSLGWVLAALLIEPFLSTLILVSMKWSLVWFSGITFSLPYCKWTRSSTKAGTISGLACHSICQCLTRLLVHSKCSVCTYSRNEGNFSSFPRPRKVGHKALSAGCLFASAVLSPRRFFLLPFPGSCSHPTKHLKDWSRPRMH